MMQQAFHDAVLTDATMQVRLAAATDIAGFAAAAGLPTADIDLPPDPLGLDRFMPAPVTRRDWPGEGWLPVQLVTTPQGPAVDWCHFGGAALAEPFFAASASGALARPFNRLFRTRMTLDDFVGGAPNSPAPDGLIFHMSRCGSTLVSQMLAAMPGNVLVSEAQPIDAALRLDLPVAALRATVAALTRGGAARRFLKLDAWHILRLTTFGQAFPDTPWVFLHRDPAEVLASQMRERGPQADPRLFPPAIYGLEAHADAADEEYIARVLARIAEAAYEGLGHGGIAVDYRDLPDALATRILPHFGIHPTADDIRAMATVAARDAKSGGAFVSASSRRSAS